MKAYIAVIAGLHEIQGGNVLLKSHIHIEGWPIVFLPKPQIVPQCSLFLEL